MSITNEAAYTPIPTTKNVTATNRDLLERSRKSNKALMNKNVTTVIEAINKKVIVHGLLVLNAQGY